MRRPTGPKATSQRLERSFRAMGTTVSLIGSVPGGSGGESRFALMADAVRDVFVRYDVMFSRFRADSELSRVNARAGRWTEVSRPFADLTAFALAGAAETGGLFDPTVLDALMAAGYDRDWAEMRREPASVQRPPPPGGGWWDVELEGQRVRLGKDVRLDLGGVAKGWTVDRAAESVAAAGLPWAVVSAGGDLRIVGRPPVGGLAVGVEDPADPSCHIAELRLDDGAMATSSVLTRSWGQGLHQIIDPRTSLPASTGVVQATVWAPTCAEAEIRSTWAMLAGPVVLDRIPGILVMDDGSIFLNLEHSVGRDPLLAEVPA
jgi:thiamine biosynthesis lipoprotein